MGKVWSSAHAKRRGRSAGQRRRWLAGGAGAELSGAGLVRERARRGSGVREAAEQCAGGGAGV